MSPAEQRQVIPLATATLWMRCKTASTALDNSRRRLPRRGIEQTQLPLVLTLRFARQLLDELRARLVGMIATPATRIAQIVNAPAASVARVIGAYARKDEAA